MTETSPIPPHLEETIHEGRRAVSSGKNVLLVGEPGSGVTLIARHLTTIVNTEDRHLRENIIIRGMADFPATHTRDGRPWVPFRAPHHTCSVAGLVGGGRPWRPGEFALAHGGILYLEELLGHSRESLKALCDAVASKYVEDHTGKWRVPADFILVGTTNDASRHRIPNHLIDVFLDVPDLPESEA